MARRSAPSSLFAKLSSKAQFAIDLAARFVEYLRSVEFPFNESRWLQRMGLVALLVRRYMNGVVVKADVAPLGLEEQIVVLHPGADATRLKYFAPHGAAEPNGFEPRRGGRV